MICVKCFLISQTDVPADLVYDGRTWCMTHFALAHADKFSVRLAASVDHEQCYYCKGWYRMPVVVHHSEDECKKAGGFDE